MSKKNLLLNTKKKKVILKYKMFSIINPRQTVLVTSRADVDVAGKSMEKDDIITLDWHTPLSFNPMLYAVVIAKARFSYKLIHESRVFAVNFMSIDNKKDVIFCGTNSGEFIDKFEETKLTKQEADKIDCSVIKESLAVIECEVVNEVEAGDHVIFIGRILGKKLNKEGKRIFHKDNYEFTTTR
jgi:flavin reductase (DIM6/NTAB) family NADH-FMN oxidoreductase RutF